MEKMTNLNAMNYVIENYADSIPTDVMEKLENMRNSLIKKSATRSKASKANAELNAQIGEIIVSVLASADSPMTVTEINKSCDELSEYSNQKLSAVLRTLVASERVVKSTAEKPKRTVFELAQSTGVWLSTPHPEKSFQKVLTSDKTYGIIKKS